jgi:hypothetical protein
MIFSQIPSPKELNWSKIINFLPPKSQYTYFFLQVFYFQLHIGFLAMLKIPLTEGVQTLHYCDTVNIYVNRS